MRRFKVVCDHCEGTGKNGDCDWCIGSGYHIVVSKYDREPLGVIEEIPFGKSEIKKKCTACNGSGWYDSCDKKGNPIPCGACDGTGLEID